MKTLTISKDLSLPVNAVTQKLAWLGTTGSGKTYGASKFAEEIWQVGAQFVVLDPVGVWYGLRLDKGGKKPSAIDIPIFGGLHGDVPLESTSGELLANLIVDSGISCILDVSQFESDAEKARFASDLANRLFFRKKAAPSAMHLFLEECQEFVPQNPQRGEERMLHAFIRMQKLGRNFGIGSSYITQRPQEVNKKALNMAQTLFVFRTTGTHERTAIEKWIEDKSLDESIAQDLPKIPTGTCHVWSPEFLKISETVKISEKETFNASATPEVGHVAQERKLAAIDLEKIRKDMAATIEKAKQDDPKVLRKRIAELEREMKKPTKPVSGVVGLDDKLIKRAVDHALTENNKEWQKKVREIVKESARFFEQISLIMRLATKATENNPLFSDFNASVVSRVAVVPQGGTSLGKRQHTPLPVERTRFDSEPALNDGSISLSKGARAVLSYLVAIAPEKRTKSQLWMVTGYSPGGGFNNLVYELTGAGLIENVDGFFVATGRHEPEMFVDIEISLEKWRSKLGLGARKIFDILWENPDVTYEKGKLASLTGYALGGGFNNNIYELTGPELVIKVNGGYEINPLARNL